ncbi:sodium channel protein Nach-like [Daphnia pulex]|uniref:sodium channel protein Nach-like n=1 Tax=Daphnia pulex TaxID=6669 RepID=UPI001EDFE2B6|nr:sodium channel protein Nach-like [Daphnia pulex]
MLDFPDKSETRNKTRYRISGRFFKHFSNNSSIHGLKFITQDGVSWFERIMWIFVCLCGILFTSFFCWKIWLKYENSSVFTSLESPRFPLNDNPFPAVTICSVNKISEKRLRFALLDPRYKNVSFATIQRTLRYMTKLDRATKKEHDLGVLSRFYKSENITATDLFDLLKRTAPHCRDFVMDCIWQGIPDKCNDYLSYRPTDDGMCCTFNGAYYNDQQLGIQSRNYQPLQIDGNGYRMGLSLVLDANVNDYSVTNGKFDGFKVLVHDGEQFPDISDRGFALGVGTETFAGLKGISTVISNQAVSTVPHKKRGCVVDGEVQLNYFTRYSQSACVAECTTRKMQKLCNCRPYFFRAEESVPLCDVENYSCISEVYEEIRRNGINTCGCLPQCNDQWFEPEISQTSFPGRGFNSSRTFTRLAEKLNLEPDLQYFKSNVAVLHVYFKEKTSFLYKTDIHYGIEDFISAVGGILSLGLGMSFIGAVELLYYLFFRCYVPVLSSSQERSSENSTEDPLPLSYRSEKDNRSLHSSSNSPNSSTLNLSDSQLEEAITKPENVKMVEIALD